MMIRAPGRRGEDVVEDVLELAHSIKRLLSAGVRQTSWLIVGFD